jgi:membrane protein
LWQLVKEAGSNWVAHKDARLGAALAYYSIFSIGPPIVIAIAVAGLIFGQEAVRGEVSSQIRGLLGDTGAAAVETMLASASRPKSGILATLLGVGALLVAAIGVVVQLKDALNTVWGVESKQGGVWSFIRTYVVSLAGVLSLGFLLLVSLLVSTFLAAGSKYLAPYLPEVMLQVLSSSVSLAFIALLFAMMFKWLPDAEVRWADVWIGALVTAVLFEVGKFGIGLYIGKQGLESSFGAAASLVVLLIWVYYSSQIVLLGAEFTRAYARRHGGASAQAAALSTQAAPPSALAAQDPLFGLAKRSPAVLLVLAFVAGWVLSRPSVQRLLASTASPTTEPLNQSGPPVEKYRK